MGARENQLNRRLVISAAAKFASKLFWNECKVLAFSWSSRGRERFQRLLCRGQGLPRTTNKAFAGRSRKMVSLSLYYWHVPQLYRSLSDNFLKHSKTSLSSERCENFITDKMIANLICPEMCADQTFPVRKLIKTEKMRRLRFMAAVCDHPFMNDANIDTSFFLYKIALQA